MIQLLQLAMSVSNMVLMLVIVKGKKQTDRPTRCRQGFKGTLVRDAVNIMLNSNGSKLGGKVVDGVLSWTQIKVNCSLNPTFARHLWFFECFPFP